MTSALLMCAPTLYDVSYTINPWMTDHIDDVDKSLSARQWSTLYWTLSKYCKVDLIEPQVGLPDMVFTANGGFVFDGGVILSRFAKPQRSGEELYFAKWFRSHQRSLFYPSVSYEGAGDHLVDSEGRHWVGTGFRTDPLVRIELQSILGHPVNLLDLIDPRFYHLDTCFCPLPNGEILWYPEAFHPSDRTTIRNSFSKSIEITETDALAFTCNCICIDQNLFIPKNNNATTVLRDLLGYTVHEFDLSEFMKAGGAAKCLILHLQ